ncbi:MAG: T9SS type A sorting domain-containing protein [Bacteroidales bacterium]|nr:T9SS type A sorting domain-containing protein [Bacteroidales bacterium]
MKTIYLTFFLLLFLVFSGLSQSQRMVLIEEATNASCGPCASQNPAFDNLLNQNRDILTAIKYHWYFPGYDPMHNHNTVENNARVSYYGINGVPTATIDGDIPNGPTFSYPGGPHGYTQALLDEYAAIPSPFNLWLSHRISDDEDSIYVDMMIEATQAVSGTLIAHMVVVEKHINFTTPPGSNGEKNFLDVMKKMIPDQFGTTLPTSFQPGEYLILQGSWELANVYKIEELGVVGFVQNNVNKDVLQAANSTAEPFTPLYDHEASITKVSNVSETNCLGTVRPELTIRNNGAEPLTQVDVYYRINDETTYLYEWTGNLGFLGSDVITLPEISFDINDENSLYAYTVDPNGVPDEYIGNDTIIQPFGRAEITPLTVKLMIRTDENPDETTWEIRNSVGELQFSGGPYSQPNTVIQETFQMEDMECYIFRIFDVGGDGLNIPGFYALYHGTNSYISNGTDFGAIDTAYFEVNTQVGIDEMQSNPPIVIFPNPARDKFTTTLWLDGQKEVRIFIYDVAGQLVTSVYAGQLMAGYQTVEINTKDLAPGLYFVRTNIGPTHQTQKITIIK